LEVPPGKDTAVPQIQQTKVKLPGYDSRDLADYKW